MSEVKLSLLSLLQFVDSKVTLRKAGIGYRKYSVVNLTQTMMNLHDSVGDGSFFFQYWDLFFVLHFFPDYYIDLLYPAALNCRAL
jgi:hypothetical protein